MRSGCGKTSGPAVQPAGSAQSTVGGSPESPGLVQYVCQPGAMRWRMPTQKDAPGSTEAVSPSRVTETFGGPGGFGAFTLGGANLDPAHAVGVVAVLPDRLGLERPIEARPAGAGVELVQRGEERLSRHHVHVDARLVMVPELVPERRLGGAALGDVVLFRSQTALQIGVGRALGGGHGVVEYTPGRRVMSDEISVQFTRFSAFYSPLIATIAGGFLQQEGFAPKHSIAPLGKSAIDGVVAGTVHVCQSAPSQGFGPLEKGQAPPAVHFAQINEMDGFFLTGRAADPSFTWDTLRGKRVLVDHGGQPLAMFKYACHKRGLDV